MKHEFECQAFGVEDAVVIASDYAFVRLGDVDQQTQQLPLVGLAHSVPSASNAPLSGRRASNASPEVR